MLAATIDGRSPGVAEIRQTLHAWQQKGQDLANRGSNSYDQCIDLVVRNCPEPFRAQELARWGIANPAVQLQAYDYQFNLEADHPLKNLTNSQRVALFSVAEKWLARILDRAKTALLDPFGITVITDGWVQAQVDYLKAEEKTAKEGARDYHGYTMTPSDKVASLYKQVKQLEALVEVLEPLAKEAEQLRDLVEALQARVEELEAA